MFCSAFRETLYLFLSHLLLRPYFSSFYLYFPLSLFIILSWFLCHSFSLLLFIFIIIPQITWSDTLYNFGGVWWGGEGWTCILWVASYLATIRTPASSRSPWHAWKSITDETLKGTVSPDILILFMMSIIKLVLFVWSLIPLRFFYFCFNFIFVSNVLLHILPITLELAESSIKSLANLASAISKVTGTLPVIFLKSLENGRQLF